MTNLIESIVSEDLEGVQQAIDNGASVILGSKQHNLHWRYSFSSPIICAAFIGNVPIFNALLKAGANIDTCSSLWGTSLMVTVNKGHSKLFEFIMNAGADVNKKKSMAKQLFLLPLGGGGTLAS